MASRTDVEGKNYTMATEKKTVKKVATITRSASTVKKATSTTKPSRAQRKAATAEKESSKKVVAKSPKAAPAKRKRAAATRDKKTPVAKTPGTDAVMQLPAPSQDDIARLAYRLWEENGYPAGTSEQDWHEAETSLRSVA